MKTGRCILAMFSMVFLVIFSFSMHVEKQKTTSANIQAK
jgi:uncharacterized membrane protein